MHNVRARILLIDDDVELAELLAEFLTPRGFDLEAVQLGNLGVQQALSSQYDIIILDVMLPDTDGFEVLRHIRKESRTPILMLTARGEDIDRIVGLELGADDYLPKPFNPRELAARLSAILRRTTTTIAENEPHHEDWLRVGDIEVNCGTREVFQNSDRIHLTGVEYDLLMLFLARAGEVIDRGDLFQRVLDRPPEPLDRSIDMHVSHLRKKIGHQHGGIERIKSIRGVGYIYTCVDAQKTPAV